MEENRQNQDMELSMLQAQYKTLQEKFNQQEIVNHNRIYEMLRSKITDFRRRNIEIVLTYVLLAAAMCWSCCCFELRLSFLAASLLLFLFLCLFELFVCRKVRQINTSDADVLTLIQKMKSVQTRFSLVWYAGVLALCLWMMWFVNELGAKQAIADLRLSFVIVAPVIAISVLLILTHIDQLARMSRELMSITARLNGSEITDEPTRRRDKAYWAGIVLVVLSLVGLVFKLMHWPFANLIYFSAVVSGVVFVLLAASHLARIVPDERPVIRLAEVACLFLVANAAFRLFHWPFSNLFAVVSLALILLASLFYVLKSRRAAKGTMNE